MIYNYKIKGVRIMANALGAEKRGISNGSDVYFLDVDERTLEEAWRVRKGVVVDDIEKASRPRISVQNGFHSEPDTSLVSAQVRMHPNNLFTLREVIGALNADEYRATPNMGVHEVSDHEIDGVLSLEIGNYLVAGALMRVLDQRAEQVVFSH